MKLITFSIILFFGTAVQVSADTRNLCKTFFRHQNLYDCIDRNNAALEILNSGVYYDSIVERCKLTTRRKIRVSFNYDYVAAERCAANEQKRVVAEERARAAAARDRSASEYLDEAAKTERAYRRKYYNK